jgi:chromosomal replication initiation ATPase DnaA
MTNAASLRSRAAAPRRTQPKTEAERFWRLILAELELQMTRYTFAAWLQGTRAVDLSADYLTVQVPSPHAKAWLENRLNLKIERTIARHAAQPVHIRYVLADYE